MAALGETCSHVAAVLFTAEANSQFKQQTSSTSLPCTWLLPSFQCVPHTEVGKLDFKTPGMKRKLAARQRNSTLDDDDNGTTNAKRELKLFLKPTEDQIANFYSQLSEHQKSLSSSHLFLVTVMHMCQPVNFLTIKTNIFV